MIFKTFNSNIDKMSAKWGIFGRSFNDIGTAITNKLIDFNDEFERTGKIITSWKDTDSIWKRLYPSKESIKSQLIDVDALYPKIDSNNFDFDGWINELNDIDKKVKAGTLSWQDYSDQLNDNQKWIAKWGQETQGSIRTQEDLVKANQQARQAAIDHNAALKQQTLGAKALTVATKALAVAGNMLLFMAISEVISLAVQSIDNYIHRIDNLKEAAEEAKSAIDDIKSDFDSLASTTDDVKKRFAALAQGVENLGTANQSQGILSTDNYNEFLDLSNQIAELFPSLTKGYDENGNAILNLSGNVNTIVGSLDNLVSVQQKLANQEILEKMPDVWTGYKVELEEYQVSLSKAEKNAKNYQNALSNISNGKVKISDSGTNSAIVSALRKLDIDPAANGKLYQVERNYKGGSNGTFKAAHWDFTQLDATQIEQLHNIQLKIV